MSKCLCPEFYCNTKLYLSPNDNVTEMVIVQDNTNGGGMLYSNVGILTLNNFAMNVLKKSLVAPNETPSIQELLPTSNDILWFQALLKTNIFKVSQFKARKKVITNYSVTANEVINPKSQLQPVALTSAGNVSYQSCNSTSVYSYVSTEDTSLSLETSVDYSTSSLLYNNYSTDICPRAYIYQNSASLTPQEDLSKLSSTCTLCSQCDNCNWCGLCILGFIAFTAGSIQSSGCASTATCS